MEVVLLFALALLSLGFVAVRQWVKMERLRLDALDRFSRKFSDSMAKILSRDVQWNEWILLDLGQWNQIASSKEHVLELAIAIMRLRKTDRQMKIVSVSKRKTEFFEKYPGLEEEYLRMKFYAVLTACLSSAVLTANLIMNYVGSMEKNPIQVDRFAESLQKRHRWPSAVLRHAS
jgi:hypothetical protein